MAMFDDIIKCRTSLGVVKSDVSKPKMKNVLQFQTIYYLSVLFKLQNSSKLPMSIAGI